MFETELSRKTYFILWQNRNNEVPKNFKLTLSRWIKHYKAYTSKNQQIKNIIKIYI